MTDNNITGRPRPLSPHLQVYKPQFTSVLSILHRASIVALYVGLFVLVFALANYAFIENCPVSAWLKTTSSGKLVTKLVLSGYALAASYWICATVRHLFWDMGKGFEIKTAYFTAKITIIATLVLAGFLIYRIW